MSSSSSKSRNMSSSSSESRNFSDQEIDQFIHVANKAADAAEEIISKYYTSNLEESPPKMPKTPRATIDKEAEEAMVITILESFPSHTVYGEETGLWDIDSFRRHQKLTCLNPSLDEEETGGWWDIDYYSSRRRNCTPVDRSFVWVLDPIYGNKLDYTLACCPFSFSTMISLLYDGKPVLGCVDQSQFEKLRWMGFKGKPTTLNGDPIHTEACEDISMAYANLKHPSLGKYARHAFDSLAHKVNDVWIDTSFAAFGDLASGRMHVVVDSYLSPCNCLALVPIVDGAGGIITDWCGRELHWSPWDGNERRKGTGFRVVAAGDRRTYEQAIDSLWP